MGHADDDFLQAELAAALDDLLERRDHRLAAVEAEALGAGIFDVEEFSKPSASTSFDRMARLPSRVKVDLLVGSLDALLDPGLLGRIGDVDEFEADGAAIGAAQDRQHLAHGREFEAEHVVDEDLAVVVGLDEAVGRRMELLVVLLRLEAERIEVGVQVAAHAEGADHHDRADRVAGGALDLAFAGGVPARPRRPCRGSCRRAPFPSPASRRRAR